MIDDMQMNVKRAIRSQFENVGVFSAAQVTELVACFDRYASNLIEEWMLTGKKWWSEDTWLRDMFITTLVFSCKQRFKASHRDACRINSQALNEKPLEGAIFTPQQVEQIVEAHGALMRAFEKVIS